MGWSGARGTCHNPPMRRPFSLWVFALVITLGAAVYQRMTGPSNASRGKVTLGKSEVQYRLPRSQGDGDAAVRVPAADAAVQGQVAWKRYQTKDAWAYVAMTREAGHWWRGCRINRRRGS